MIVTKAWEVSTAIAEIDSYQREIARQRARLKQIWAALTADVTVVEGQLNLLDATVSHRAIALRELLQRNPTFTYAQEPLAGGDPSVALARNQDGSIHGFDAIGARFDHSLQLAHVELREADRKSRGSRSRAHNRATEHLDKCRRVLATFQMVRVEIEDRLRRAGAQRSQKAAVARVEADSSLAPVAHIASQALLRLPPAMRPWTDPVWDDGWAQLASIVGADQMFAGTLTPARDPSLGDNSDFATSSTLPLLLPASTNLNIIQDSTNHDESLALARSLLLRALVATEPGRLKLSFFDPAGLGRSAATLLELAEYEPALIGGKVWSSSADLMAQLREHTAHIELVIQKYLRTTYNSIDAFNLEAGEIAEPYRYLVIFDFPLGFSEDALRELQRVVENGPQCGVRTLIVSNTEMPIPFGINTGVLDNAMRKIDTRSAFTYDHAGYQLVLNLWPDGDLAGGGRQAKAIVETVGRNAAKQGDAVLSFARAFELFREGSRRGIRRDIPAGAASVDLVDPETWWRCSTTSGLAAPIGQKGARDAAVLAFDSTDHAGALLVGRPGAGKSTLLHTFIAGLTTTYGPEELELYLIDFKEGVEFKMYAAEGLPHARCVAIESDREFGLSVLQSLEAELSRRGQLLRASAGQFSGLEQLRRETGDLLPRVLLVFDEFHVLFNRNDKIGLAAADLLELLIRQGRGFGIHVLLGSQSLAGLDALGSHVPQLLPVRILLPAAESDARRLLGDGNNGGQYLALHGEGILNQAGGTVEANERFKGALISGDDRLKHLRSLRLKANTQGFTRLPIVFEGNSAVPIATISPSRFREELTSSGRAPLRIRVGEPMVIDGNSDFELRRESGANVLVVARGSRASDINVDPSMDMPSALLASAVASAVCSPAFIDVVDFTPVDEGIEVLLEPLLEADRVSVHRRRGFPGVVNDLLTEVRSRVDQDDSSAPARFLFLYGIHRARELDADVTTLDSDSSLGDALVEIFRDGPEVGVHAWVWAETVGSLARKLPATAIRELGWRVAGRMSTDDSQMLFGTYNAAELRDQQVVVANDDLGLVRRSIAYGRPDSDWLSQLIRLAP